MWARESRSDDAADGVHEGIIVVTNDSKSWRRELQASFHIPCPLFGVRIPAIMRPPL